MRVVHLIILGAALLGSCTSSQQPPRETVLREGYMFFRAVATAPWRGGEQDTTKFATFAAEATADTGSWNAMLAAWKQTRASFSSVLGQLGYGTGPFTWRYGAREKIALSGFQRDLGIPVTGQLDSSTVWHLLDAQTALGKADIKLPPFDVGIIGGSILATGTWKAVTNKLGYPVNTVSIECNPVTGDCTATSVEFISGALDQVFWVRSQSLHIVHWDEEELIAKSRDEPDITHITLAINLPAKDVTWTQEMPGYLPPYDVQLRWRPSSARLSAAWTGSAEPDTSHPLRMTLKLVDGTKLSPPFDGGDLKAEHESLFKSKEQYLALQAKNMTVR